MLTLISADTVIVDDFVTPAAVSDTAVAIAADGTIRAVLPTAEALATLTVDKHIELPHHILMPGLINAHGHAAMTLLRGYSDDQPLQTWLQDHIWPAENQWLSPDFVRDGSQLAMAEMLQSGTTCFADMYFFPDVTAAAANEAGMRAQIAFPVFDFATAWGSGPDDYISKGLELHDKYKSHSLIDIAFGPHAPYTVGDEALRRIATLSNEIEARIHIHVHETAFEVSDAIRNSGKRPLQRLYDLGLLNHRTQCVHMTQLDDSDFSLLLQTGASVVHCPQSNQKIACGIAPVSTLLARGLAVGLGTDGAASNNSLSMFTEMKAAALQAKISEQNPAAIAAATALAMATLGSARALGLEQRIGSLRPGKQADMVAINTRSAAMQPLHNAVSQLVYSQPGVDHVWVNGRQLLKDGELTTLNLKQILQRAQHWGQKISL